MILRMDVRDVLAQVADLALAKGSGRDGRAIHIRVDARAYNYKLHQDHEGNLTPVEEGEEDIEDHARTSKDVHFIIYRPTNYTQVYVCVNNSWSIPKPEEFTLTSDHDSCWRSDGFRVLNKVGSDLWDAVSTEECRKVDQFVSLTVSKVTVKSERVPGKNWGPGRKRLVSIEREWPS